MRDGIKNPERREFLKSLSRYGLALYTVGSGLFLGCEGIPVSTDEAYGPEWKLIAEETIREIKKYDRIVREKHGSEEALQAQEKLLDIYIDPVLQEFPYLKEKNMIVNKKISMGRYEIEVLEYTGPIRYPEGISSVEVKLNVYRDGKQIDINPWNPFSKSRHIYLQGKDWSLRKIME